MKYAVITPYYKEPTEKLWRCHASVKAQTIPADQIMVADGHPNPEVDNWPVTHIRLPIPQNDTGYTPRMIGLLTASALNYDGYLLLDADCWIEPNHIEQMALTQRQTGAEIITCPRNLRRLDESLWASAPKAMASFSTTAIVTCSPKRRWSTFGPCASPIAAKPILQTARCGRTCAPSKRE